MKQIRKYFDNESRGVSEAISQALLFLTIMVSITVLSGSVAPIIDTAQQSHTIDQTTASFGEIDDVSKEYRFKSSEDQYSTANHTVPVNTFTGNLETPPSTNITLKGNNPPYDSHVTIYSDPLRLSTSDYYLTYDTGIIQYESIDQSITYRTPADIVGGNKDKLVLVTHDINEGYIENSTQNHQIIISQKHPPEIGTITAGSEIEITTQNSVVNGWVTYFDSIPNTDVADINPISSNRSRIDVNVNEDMDIYHHKLNMR